MGKVVAIKELLSSHDDDPVVVKQTFLEFQKEVSIMSALNHPNLVPLFAIAVKPRLRMIMEYYPLGDLQNFHYPDKTLTQRTRENKDESERIREMLAGFRVDSEQLKAEQLRLQGRLKELTAQHARLRKKQRKLDLKFPWSLKYKIALDIAKAMQYLHSLTPPIVHRDLKSNNVFMVSISEDSIIHAKVADFGLSRRVVAGLSEAALGSWQWLAPEINNAGDYDEKSDIYSFGMTLWEIVNSPGFEIPFEEYSQAMPEHAIKNAVVEGNLRPTIPSYCPSVLSEIIDECWNRSPSARPSFTKLVQTLGRLAFGEEDLSRPENSALVKQRSYYSLRAKQNYTCAECNGAIAKGEVYYKSSLQPRYQNSNRFCINCKEKSDASEKPCVEELVTSIYELDTSCEPEAGVCEICQVRNSVWVGLKNGTMLVFDRDGVQQGSFKAHNSRIYSIIARGKEIWSCATDNFITIWKPKQSNPGHVSLSWEIKSICRKLLLVPDKNKDEQRVWCVCVGAENSVQVYDIHGGHRHSIKSFDEESPSTIAFSNSVWVGTSRGNIQTYSKRTYEHLRTFNSCHRNAITSFLAIGDKMWSAGQDHVIRVWSRDGEKERELRSHESKVMVMCATRLHVWSGAADAVLVWDPETYLCLEEIAPPRHSSGSMTDVVRTIAEIGHNRVWAGSFDQVLSIWKPNVEPSREEK